MEHDLTKLITTFCPLADRDVVAMIYNGCRNYEMSCTILSEMLGMQFTIEPQPVVSVEQVRVEVVQHQVNREVPVQLVDVHPDACSTFLGQAFRPEVCKKCYKAKKHHSVESAMYEELQELELERLKANLENRKKEIRDHFLQEQQKVMGQFTNYSFADDELLCKICFEKEIDTKLVPCSHNEFCYNCVRTLHSCPICRRSMDVVRI